MLRRWAGPVALVLGGLVVAFLLAEVGLRLAQPIPPERLLPFPYKHAELQRIVRDPGSYFRFDAELGWSLRPVTNGRFGDHVYRTNRAGLRAERDYATDLPPGVRRLAAFGDSFTHCDEVANPDCWTAMLEEAWPGTEVLNFGVPAYGPDQAWLRYQRDGRAYQPCAVLIGYMVENVNRVVNRFRPFYTPSSNFVLGKPRFVLDGDALRLLPNLATTPELLDDPRWVEETLGPQDEWYFPGIFVANPLDVSYVVRVARTAAYSRRVADRGGTNYLTQRFTRAYAEEQEGYQIAGRLLIHFARQVEQDGATPVVVVFGRQHEVMALSRGDGKVHAPLLAWLARERLPTIDVTDDLASAAQRVAVEELFAVGGHYHPLANQVVSETLERRLPELVGGTCGPR